MPLIRPSTYHPSPIYRNAHAASILPSSLRRITPPPLVRERLEIPDGDFIDLDCWRQSSDRTVVLCHGLEGSTNRQYMRGMAWAFGAKGWNVVAYNYRGCSGEPNRTLRTYHSGATDDLRLVLEHAVGIGAGTMALVGFSLGGNLILKYLGESPQDVEPSIAAAVAISAPVDLAVCSRQLDRPTNWIYNRRFLAKLDRKIREMASLHPGAIDTEPLTRVASITDFDDLYTAPMHGFTDAADLYKQCSARQFLDAITTPSLLISALNDPFLGPSCYPVEEAERSSCFHLETPAHGGHVGFHAPGPLYWSEQRAVAFVDGVLARR